jgi:hypothetical protein
MGLGLLSMWGVRGGWRCIHGRRLGGGPVAGGGDEEQDEGDANDEDVEQVPAGRAVGPGARRVGGGRRREPSPPARARIRTAADRGAARTHTNPACIAPGPLGPSREPSPDRAKRGAQAAGRGRGPLGPLAG